MEQYRRPHAVRACLSLAICAGESFKQSSAVQVLDSLITSLVKHTSLLNPAMPQASIAFGADELSCMATETMFELANRCATAQTAPCPPSLVLWTRAFHLQVPTRCVDHYACVMTLVKEESISRRPFAARLSCPIAIYPSGSLPVDSSRGSSNGMSV